MIVYTGLIIRTGLARSNGDDDLRLITDSIASVPHITEAAISKRRHRGRKVPGLSVDQGLEKYLAEI